MKPVPTMAAKGVTEIVVSMSGYRQEVRDYVKQFVNVLHQHAPGNECNIVLFID